MVQARRSLLGVLFLPIVMIILSGSLFAQDGSEGMQVDAGEDVNLLLQGGVGSTVTATFNALVTNAPDGEVNFLWFVESGPDSVEFSDEVSNITDAIFRRPGTYVITFRVTVGGTVGTDDVTVTVGPEVITLVVSKAKFHAAPEKLPKSKLYFTMAGVNTDDKKLDLRPNDRFFVRFGDIFVGEFLNAPPDGDFMRMDVRRKARPTNVGGQTFDSGNSAFKKVRARYRPRGTGRLTFKATGGAFDLANLPTAVNGTATIAIAVWVERVEYDSTVRFVYRHDILVSLVPTSSGGLKGRNVRP